MPDGHALLKTSPRQDISLGGVRIPQIERPVARFRTHAPPGGVRMWSAESFSDKEVKSLYGGREAYLELYREMVAEMVKTDGSSKPRPPGSSTPPTVHHSRSSLSSVHRLL